MKKTILQIATIFICWILLATSFTINLTPNIAKAEGTNTTSGGAGGDDGVDPATGKFNQIFPLINIPGRGINLQLTLRYNSRIWLADPDGEDGGTTIGVPTPLVYNGNHAWLEDYSPTGLGFDLSMGRLYGQCYRCQMSNYSYRYYYRFSFESPSGGRLLFVSDNPDYTNGHDDRFVALDESGAVLLVNAWEGTGSDHRPTNMTVVLPDGTRYLFGSSQLGRSGSGFGQTHTTLDDGDSGGSGSGSDSGVGTLTQFEWFLLIQAGFFWDLYSQYLSEGNTNVPYYATPWFGCPINLRGTGSAIVTPVLQGQEEVGSASWACHAIKDMNDNTVSISYYPHPDTSYPHVLSLPHVITDTYGRTITCVADNDTSDPDNMTVGYPEIRLTEINTRISATGNLYRIIFNYADNNTDGSPYEIIGDSEGRGGPFEDMTSPDFKRRVTTQKGDTPEARTRVILQSLTVNPQTPGVRPRTITFGYNNYSELVSIALPTGAVKRIYYDCSRVASCFKGSQIDGYPIGTRGQDIRVATASEIDDGTGQTSRTEYQYIIHTDNSGEPDYMGFSKTIKTHPGTNIRIEYEYYSDTPGNILYYGYRNIWHGRPSRDLAGLLHTTTTYEDHDFTDDDPGTLKQTKKIFYGSVDSQFNREYDPYLNSWKFIRSMGFLTEQDGQSSIVIKGIDGAGTIHSYSQGNYDGEIDGFRTYWIIQSDELQFAVQDISYPPSFSVQLANPYNVKIQNIFTMNEQGTNPDYSQYKAQGLWQLPVTIEEGDITHYYADFEEVGPGLLLMNWYIQPRYAFGHGDNPGHEYPWIANDYPFAYHTLKTTQLQYDTRHLIDPISYHEASTSNIRGLVTQSTILETGETVKNTYFTNGFLYQQRTYIQTDLASTTTYKYGKANNGMLSETTIIADADNHGTDYPAVTTTYSHNALGQVTKQTDKQNGDVEEFSTDGYGRLRTHTINGHVIEVNQYLDDLIMDGEISVTTTTIAGTKLSDRTVVKTYYDGLKRAIRTVERNGDESEWITASTILYDASGRVVGKSLPTPVGASLPGRWMSYNSYDVFGRLTEDTDEYGRTTSTEIIPITQPEDDHDPNYKLWQIGIRTKTVTSSSSGAETITFSDAQGHVLQSSVKISDGVYADTKYYYDNGGRLYIQESPEGISTLYYYDQVGRLVGSNTGDESVDFHLTYGEDFQYPNDDFVDPGDAYADTLIEAFTLSGQPLLVRTARGFLHFTYDGAGRVLRKDHSMTREGPWTVLEEHSYNPQDALNPEISKSAGRITKSSYFDLQNGQAYTIQYCYGEQGLVESQRVEFGYGGSEKILQFEYDWIGRLTTLEYPTTDNGRNVVRYAYQGPRMTSITLNNQPLIGAYYDTFRRLSSLHYGTGTLLTSFNYDNLNDRLISFSAMTNNAADPRNDMLKQTRTTEKINNPNDETEEPDTETVTTQLLETYTYDTVSGELAQIRGNANALKREYAYDLMGRLTQATLAGVRYNPKTETYAESPDETTSIRYSLNKDSLRTSQYIRCYTTLTGDSSVKETQTYLYTQNTHQLSSITRNNISIFSQEYDNGGSVAVYNTNTIERDCLGQITQYKGESYGYMAGMRVRRTTSTGETSYALYICGQLLAEYKNDGTCIRNHYYGFGQRLMTQGINEKTTYLVSDPHGNLRLITSMNGDIIWKGDYTPYGETIGKSQPVGQTGFDGYIKEDTGLTYAYARDYSEKTGTFLSIDPLNAGANPYTYCSGSPIQCRDSAGLEPHWAYYPGSGWMWTLDEIEVNPGIHESDCFGDWQDCSIGGGYATDSGNFHYTTQDGTARQGYRQDPISWSYLSITRFSERLAIHFSAAAKNINNPYLLRVLYSVDASFYDAFTPENAPSTIVLLLLRSPRIMVGDQIIGANFQISKAYMNIRVDMPHAGGAHCIYPHLQIGGGVHGVTKYRNWLKIDLRPI